ncbi:MAG: glycosyltransferase family 1 protein [Fidelibacterota bacterium]|nr:MAG: glycosyltransferase family 1 protein [Candidatus Neomarinimicrobiota bacterium]
MIKVVHLFNHHTGARYPAMISQGLWLHPEVEVSYNMPFISLGKEICPADSNLETSLLGAEYIFRAGDSHFGIADVDGLLDGHDLWGKVIYYDFKDEAAIDTHRLQTCHAYLKRNWSSGYDRRPLAPAPVPILPVDFGLLSEYYVDPIPVEKDIDIAYLFPPDQRIGRRRYSVYEELDRVRGAFSSPAIGVPTASARVGRRAIFDPPEGNPFLAYLRMLKRAKIVFTAFPDEHDGDSRTWEAFSSGAMVFMDTTHIPSPQPFVHGKHCYIYDARDRDSICTAIDTAMEYLKDDAGRENIAQQGLEHALMYHKPEDRISMILKWVRSSPRILTDHVQLYHPA